MIFEYRNLYQWPGGWFRGDLYLAWPWLFAIAVLLTLLVLALFRRLRRPRGEGEPYRTQLANAEQVMKVQKEGFEAERQLLTKRLHEASGHIAPLCATINTALGPSYGAKSVVTAIEAVKEFQDWSERFTAELKNAAPATFANYPANVLAQHGTREAFRAFVLRTARASGEVGAEALSAKERTIKVLEASILSREVSITQLNEEITRLGGIVNSQKVRISQLESEIPALRPDALDSVRRVSKNRD